ncbi:hypothetical protein FRE64_17310 (plasmid) [Euhalothece natronophila Z-M001]|uniref:Uncharacterized protein n=1 Tax=Euhalothece natronophila Z-M001 TaxID=522448 RepID=A0A5B8NTM9_9CHRO|nr:hypothetical protein [Euhalothece natronophila]QDZ41704.1 hypothetical protein FRE64_17230 [Euhalothece natronophila Z-M001]QDZ41719.1 hypothetical protein FRE64_17310 [Euhalothece natronophila Z-M001]
MLTGNQAFAQTQAVTPFNLRVLDTNIAATFGSDEALFLSQLQYWISKGYGVLYKGKRWIYNTYEQWIQQMPWLTRDRFKRMIKKLLNSEVLMIEKLKAHEWKQTNFYTINEEALKAKIPMPNASGGSNLSSGRLSTDDLYTENTTIKTERESENSVSQESIKLDHKEEQVEASSNGKPQEDNASTADSVENSPNSGDDPSSEPIENKLHLVPFHKELLRILQFCDGIQNPCAYAQKCVDNLRAGSPSSMEVYKKWAETGEIVLEDVLHQKESQASEKGKNPSSVQPSQTEVTQQGNQSKDEQPKPKHESKVNEGLREWQIQPDDTDLIEAGYSVGQIYPEFVQWATPRLKYHPDLTEYAAKSHAIYKLKKEPQLTLEMWRDFKRLLTREVEDKKENESKGLPYFTPAWMQLPADVPVSEARKASVELNEAKVKEQQAIEANRTQKPALTGGEDEKAIESSEEEEVLEPIENVKNAIALMEQYPDHPATKMIVQNTINHAKANASESELEEIQRLEDEAFEF